MISRKFDLYQTPAIYGRNKLANTCGSFPPLRRSEKSRKVKVRNKTICGRKMLASPSYSKKEKKLYKKTPRPSTGSSLLLNTFGGGIFLSHNPLQNVYLPQAITILYRCSAVYASNQQIQATVDIAIFSELTILTLSYTITYILNGHQCSALFGNIKYIFCHEFMI